MKIIERLLAILLFLVLVGFAIVNTNIVELQFIGTDLRWRQPLVVFLLMFFAAGIVLGLLAVIPTWFRQKREIARLKKSVKALEIAAQSQASAVASKPSTALDALVAAQSPIPL